MSTPEAAKEVFDLSFGRTREERVLNDLLERFAHDARKQRGPHNQNGEAAECVAAGEVSPLPGSPEIDDHGKHGTGMQHHQQQRHSG